MPPAGALPHIPPLERKEKNTPASVAVRYPMPPDTEVLYHTVFAEAIPHMPDRIYPPEIITTGLELKINPGLFPQRKE
jgi:hypothetical protein